MTGSKWEDSLVYINSAFPNQQMLSHCKCTHKTFKRGPSHLSNTVATIERPRELRYRKNYESNLNKVFRREIL